MTKILKKYRFPNITKLFKNCIQMLKIPLPSMPLHEFKNAPYEIPPGYRILENGNVFDVMTFGVTDF